MSVWCISGCRICEKPKIKTVHSKKTSTISSNFLDNILYRKIHYPWPKRLWVISKFYVANVLFFFFFFWWNNTQGCFFPKFLLASWRHVWPKYNTIILNIHVLWNNLIRGAYIPGLSNFLYGSWGIFDIFHWIYFFY